MTTTTSSESFDPDTLRNRYKEEREKRLRPDGNKQYQGMTGDYSYFIEDPYVAEAIVSVVVWVAC